MSDNWLDIPSYSRRWGFATENAEELLERVVSFNEGPVLDFFAGSATTCAVALKTGRKWVGVEAGEHFEEVTLPRMKAALSGEAGGISGAANWHGGGIIEVLTLESYEDTLANIALRQRPEAQQALLDRKANVREDYLLHYLLPHEAEGSASLLDRDRFDAPFAYTLYVVQEGETRETPVDLPETFNWLLGLTVERIRFVDGLQIVEGTAPDGARTLVIWRTLHDPRHSNERLETFFRQTYLSRPPEELPQRVYVNGDCTLASHRSEGATWTVHLTEEAFHRLMFAAADGPVT